MNALETISSGTAVRVPPRPYVCHPHVACVHAAASSAFRPFVPIDDERGRLLYWAATCDCGVVYYYPANGG